jgi:hypothetical protein
MIMKWTSVCNGVKISHIVACQNLSELKPATLEKMVNSTLTALHDCGFAVCVLVGDGAGENVKLFKSLSTIPISKFLPEDLQKQFPQTNYDMCVAMLHPDTLEPIFILEDMPHVVKRLVNALENSSKKTSKRDLRYGRKQPMNLRMIQLVWEGTQGRTTRLQDTALTMGHFVKDAYSRMNVQLAVQVLSSRVVALLDKARNDSVLWPQITKFKPGQYRSLVALAENMNELVDITNGRFVNKGKSTNVYTAHFTPASARDIQVSYLKILSFFSTWAKLVKADEELGDSNFLADPTWMGIQRMMLGYAGLIQYYVVKKGWTIVPRRTTSDPCEHHFANARASFGSTDSGTAVQANAARVASDIVGLSQQMMLGGKGNNSGAPTSPSSKAPPPKPKPLFSRRDHW